VIVRLPRGVGAWVLRKARRATSFRARGRLTELYALEDEIGYLMKTTKPAGIYTRGPEG